MADIVQTIHNLFKNKALVFISAEELETLLANTEVVQETDTLMMHNIRILKADVKYWVQERSPKNEIIIRQFDNIGQAEEFVADRLHIYEKMWDGCGCKIDYYL